MLLEMAVQQHRRVSRPLDTLYKLAQVCRCRCICRCRCRCRCRCLDSLHKLAQELMVIEAEALEPLARLGQLTSLMLALVHLQVSPNP